MHDCVTFFFYKNATFDDAKENHTNQQSALECTVLVQQKIDEWTSLPEI